ncbi:winged helix-turn-helix domain-containing protein [Cupriavidus oxalaticus]|uniref:LysR family transcriptional regulator n=1 Tax=Cupriavidus oxalaticus TaxID=96344 RepID=A0A5P3VT36_9BURK|nr:LysR family transcriptional regulator [Cupriavidus oxalaticus]QEZ48713.1 LysR family transcriptional regulator [Cupriavidus oxalaticus]
MNIRFELFPVLDIADNPRVSERILRLLDAIRETRSIGKAAAASGFSQRHAWTLIRNLEKFIGQQLVVGERGNGSMLTAYAMRLLQAERRYRESVQPVLEAAMAEFAAALQEEDYRP